MESLCKVLEVVNTFVTSSHVQRARHDLVTIQWLGTCNLCSGSGLFSMINPWLPCYNYYLCFVRVYINLQIRKNLEVLKTYSEHPCPLLNIQLWWCFLYNSYCFIPNCHWTRDWPSISELCAVYWK